MCSSRYYVYRISCVYIISTSVCICVYKWKAPLHSGMTSGAARLSRAARLPTLSNTCSANVRLSLSLSLCVCMYVCMYVCVHCHALKLFLMLFIQGHTMWKNHLICDMWYVICDGCVYLSLLSSLTGTDRQFNSPLSPSSFFYNLPTKKNKRYDFLLSLVCSQTY